MADLGSKLSEGFQSVFDETALNKLSLSARKIMRKANKRKSNFGLLNQGHKRKGFRRVKISGRRYTFKRLDPTKRHMIR